MEPFRTSCGASVIQLATETNWWWKGLVVPGGGVSGTEQIPEEPEHIGTDSEINANSAKSTRKLLKSVMPFYEEPQIIKINK